METLKDELRSYDTTTATIRFAADKPLSEALVQTLVKRASRKRGETEGLWTTPARCFSAEHRLARDR
jgi:hypothetical protein